MQKLILNLAIVAGAVVSASACQPQQGGSKELNDRIAALEKRVEAVEKRPAAAGKPAATPPPPQTAAYSIPVGSSPILGSKDAKVTVSLFSDFQCPYCSRVDPLMKEIVKDPELKDKVNVTFKHFPLSFHQQARPASKAALAAHEQGKFWEMSEKLFSDQKGLNSENFSKWAKEIGLDVKKFEKDLKEKDAEYEKILNADMELGTKTANVRGTPSIFVGGWELRERSVDGVKKLLKEKNLM